MTQVVSTSIHGCIWTWIRLCTCKGVHQYSVISPGKMIFEVLELCRDSTTGWHAKSRYVDDGVSWLTCCRDSTTGWHVKSRYVDDSVSWLTCCRDSATGWHVKSSYVDDGVSWLTCCRDSTTGWHVKSSYVDDGVSWLTCCRDSATGWHIKSSYVDDGVSWLTCCREFCRSPCRVTWACSVRMAEPWSGQWSAVYWGPTAACPVWDVAGSCCTGRQCQPRCRAWSSVSTQATSDTQADPHFHYQRLTTKYINVWHTHRHIHTSTINVWHNVR